MNTIGWLIYAASAADGIKNVGIGAAIFGGCATVISIVAYLVNRHVEDDDMKPLFLRTMRASVATFCIGCAFAALTPDHDTVLMMVTADIAQTILESKDGQVIEGQLGGIAQDSLKVLQRYLDKQLATEPTP